MFFRKMFFIPFSIVMITLFSCESDKTFEDIISEIPAKNIINYNYSLQTSLLERLNNSGELVLDYLKVMDQDDTYTFYNLSDEDKALLTEYLDLLPELYKNILQHKLIGIYFVNDFLGSGMADYVLSETGELYYLLVLNPIILQKNLSELVSYKENTCFKSDNSDISMKITLSNDYSGLMYILMHEVTHIIDYENRITPYTETNLAELLDKKEDPSPFTDKYWVDYYDLNDFLKIHYKDKLNFYTEKPDLKISNVEMIKVYSEFKDTPFASLYSYMSWAEDFADYVTFYHFTQNLNMEYTITILEGDNPIFEYEPFTNKMVLERVRNLDNFN